jgi:hypothetical protein
VLHCPEAGATGCRVVVAPDMLEVHYEEPVERFWRVLRRRATHNRLFVTMTELRTALRASFCYFHTMRYKLLSLLHSPHKKKAAKLTAA